MAKKENETEIDEDFLLASIGDKKEGKVSIEKEEKVESVEPQKAKEPPINRRSKRSNNNPEDYATTFLCRNEIRERKSIYVSQLVHEKVKLIIKRIADDDASVGGYIDNVLKHHLEKYKEEINTLNRNEKDDLIDLELW
ncbi:DUF3408 domain-containing protein [Dysgonomonas sp. 520]|uniref:DUF3408 domain-containing protein n=1 Tax=Dysgonomonas sp. 520 TaxID=2302931 RepID=UPI0013D2972C|nr:DUF3408 domain-containing protein [Dysgonomonas sp. 520]MDL2302810.1 DUF3408 domain-containing protein [Dysgonomonas sp. OttesenSCG-928-D17]NDW10218.1 DUF3408 domain-containing protein [Dysgonomonas sp. 520]